uniref:SAP domain-containing ribonucleoprotein n=1 Tax=Cebus imitator TaxID=2715852 RepID=A0A2K5RDJ3_CEBIM
MATETVELCKLKLAELKQECLAHGLETKGIKQDLIHRLQAYLEEHTEEESWGDTNRRHPLSSCKKTKTHTLKL